MSKKQKRKAVYKNKQLSRKKDIDPRIEVLKQMLQCGNCADAGTYIERDFDSAHDRVEFCVENLPGFKKAEEQFINYMFADGMGAGGVAEDEKLDNFRFRLNMQNTTNNDVLRDAIRLAHCRYGECGVRWKDDNVYLYKAGTYAPLVIKNDGIEEVLGYITTKNGDFMGESEIDMKSILQSQTYAEIEDMFDRQGYILLDKSEFVNFRNDTSKLHGTPPLEKDKLRIDLLISVYERLNYDINYDGIGRILLPIKSGYIGDEENEVSTSKIVRTVGTQAERNKAGMAEAERIATDIHDSSSDSVIAISDGFKEPIHLPRVTKATEFLEWIQKMEGQIIADIIGLPPSLLEEGELSGNVSMTRIVDNAMLNSVVSYREHYISQGSSMIASHLGLSKVFFKKYTLQSEESQTQKWSKVASSLYQLAMAYSKAPSSELENVIKTFAGMLDYDTHDSVGGIVELAENMESTNEKEKKSWLKRMRFTKY